MRPARCHHAAERTFGIQQMILAHHIGQGLRPEPVGKRTRCVFGKPAGLEQIAHAPSIKLALTERQRRAVWPARN